jgi:hypothetical protein
MKKVSRTTEVRDAQHDATKHVAGEKPEEGAARNPTKTDGAAATHSPTPDEDGGARER